MIGVSLVLALVAWLPRTDIILSAALAVLGTVQVALAGATKWVGALHPLGALFVLVLVVGLLRRGRGGSTSPRWAESIADGCRPAHCAAATRARRPRPRQASRQSAG
jgi:hypothetical protein